MKQNHKNHHLSYRELRDLRTQLKQAIDAGQREKAVVLATRYGDTKDYQGEDLFLIGRAMYMDQQQEKAEALFLAALQDKGLPDWCRGAVGSILAELLQKIGRIAEAVPYYELSLSCKDMNSGWGEEYSNYLFHLHYLGYPQKVMLAKAKAYGQAFQTVQQYLHVPVPRHEKIHVGYVSPDLCRHIVDFFSYAFLQSYDRVCFEVYCYTNCQEDEVSAELRAKVDGWRNVQGKDWQEIAAVIHNDEIDILVDMAGHTAHNMLPVFAFKPAPIQVSGVGYFDTTGLPQMDYFLADTYTDPPENEAFFTEKLLRLPHSHLCYMWHDAPGEPGPLPAGRNGYITFGSLNNLAKVNDQVLETWSRILAQVPDSHLYLKAAGLNHVYGRKLLLQRLKQAGIPAERVILTSSGPAYLNAYQDIDIALDTFPYPGGGTTCDALYMGIPVVTLCGERHNARFGYSLLMNIGLKRCCADSLDDYVQKAVNLTRDMDRLRDIRQMLRRQMRQSPVMDMSRYMIDVETAYHRIYQNWLNGGKTPAQQKKEWQRLQVCLKKAYDKKAWENVIRLGSTLTVEKEYIQPYAAAIGRGYLNLPIPDWPRMTWYFEQADRQTTVRQIEYDWLAGMGENRQLHHIQAARWYKMSAKVCMRMQKIGDKASKIFWQNPAFQTELNTQQAVNDLVMGSIVEAADHYHRAEQTATSLHDHCQLYGSWLMTLHHHWLHPAEMLDAHKGFQQLFAGIRCYDHAKHSQHDRIRIGYLSGDFRHHVMFYFYYQLLAGHDSSRFELYAYYTNCIYDGFTKLVKESVDVWREVPLTDPAKTATQIYADGIDILIDLGGHSSGSGLPALAWKPAPVQISGLGYMDTTGLGMVDYLITDVCCDPVGQSLYIAEKPLYLSSMFCYTGRNDLPVCQGAPCLQTGYITFGVFNRYQKITDEALQLWLIIQRKVKDSQILLKSEAFQDDGIGDLAYERMKQFGFDMGRVILEPSSVDYMQRYLAVDIALDTFPYVGGGTSCDALYMGVPVVSLYGEGRASRFGLSVLTAVGLGELAVADGASYVERVLALAADTELLDGLHKNLRGIMLNSRLMDTRQYVQEMETAYEDIWKEYTTGTVCDAFYGE